VFPYFGRIFVPAFAFSQLGALKRDELAQDRGWQNCVQRDQTYINRLDGYTMYQNWSASELSPSLRSFEMKAQGRGFVWFTGFWTVTQKFRGSFARSSTGFPLQQVLARRGGGSGGSGRRAGTAGGSGRSGTSSCPPSRRRDPLQPLGLYFF